MDFMAIYLDQLKNGDELAHEGVKRRSGRYPYGSGDNPYQHDGSLRAYHKRMLEEGFKPAEIASSLGISINEMRARMAKERSDERKINIQQAMAYQEAGLSITEAALKMGVQYNTYRNYIKEATEHKKTVLENTRDVIEKRVLEKGMVDVGKGTEQYMGVTRNRLDSAIKTLQDDGYVVETLRVQQMTNPLNKTGTMVIAKPGTEIKDMYKNLDKISSIEDFSQDGGETFKKRVPPKNIDSSRVAIKYAEEGGIDKDGVIEIRRGVPDLDLGKAHYAQVRIALDGTHYLKGMAVYSDDIPEGKDILVNSNKHIGTPPGDVFKKQKKDNPLNPFGAAVKDEDDLKMVQRYYTDENGNQQLSALNIVNEEGSWSNWKKSLSAQFLSKQPTDLARRQLEKTYDDKLAEFEELKSLTNPVLKKSLLTDFADDCDNSAVELKASAIHGQSSNVILPVLSLKENEIYAPHYENGTEVVLIRYPHGGIFEIPRLKVNNKNSEAKKTIGTAPLDAVGINPKVAEQLSGADFDGDTVLCIPTKGTGIVNKPYLESLKGFDPKMYKVEGKGEGGTMTKAQRQTEMGRVTNLIMDMTLLGAQDDEKLSRAIKQSMVVIDAYKHGLDWKQAEEDNRIAELHEEYQGNKRGGAATIITRAKKEVDQSHTKMYYHIDPKTGEKITTPDPRMKYDKKTGTYVEEYDKVPMMSTVKDANELVSVRKHPTELVYADYANAMKSMANEARLEVLNTPRGRFSQSAKETYANEVASLQEKIRVNEINAPKERMAQRAALVEWQILRDDAKAKGEPIDKEKEGKIRNQILTEKRAVYGAERKGIEITDREWEAIQSHAVAVQDQEYIFKNTDPDKLRERAMPKTQIAIPKVTQDRIKTLIARGFSIAEVADAVDCSTSTVEKYM